MAIINLFISSLYKLFGISTSWWNSWFTYRIFTGCVILLVTQIFLPVTISLLNDTDFLFYSRGENSVV